MRTLILATVLSVLLAGHAWSQSVEIPPRPVSGWVHDSTGTLSESSITRLNQLCDRVADQPEGQLAVAVIPTTGGEVPRTFGTRLFNAWGVGNAETNDGVLLFVALDDRQAEIVLGDGIDDTQHETIARGILSDYMIPQFKRGQPEQAILIAADECATALLELKPTNAERQLAPAGRTETQQPAAAAGPGQRQRPKRSLLWIVGGILAGASGLGASGLVASLWLRHRTRKCPTCRITMIKLTESEEDKHLSDAQKAEQRVQSVNYDVWSCPTCPYVLKLPHRAWVTSYAKCPQCASRTKSSTQSTIQAATQSAAGLEEIHEECENCDYSHTYTKSTPPITSSSSGSNASSGGGFGGGSSSGGGASGSW